MKIISLCSHRAGFFRAQSLGFAVLTSAVLAALGSPALAICNGVDACDDVNQIAVDGRNETGAFTGMGACFAYEDRGFDGDRLTLELRRKFNYVGGDFNDEISSFRVAAGCVVVAWEHRDQQGAETTFYSDAEYVGDLWNDDISSFACRCQ